MTTKRKLFTPFGFKALVDEEPGTFEAIVSVFDNVDAHGDIIRPGTFADAIRKMKKSKSPWPVVFSHQSWDLDSIMGITLDAAEIKPGDARIPRDAPPELKAGGGLWVKGRMADLEDPFTSKVWTRMKDGRIVQWSYQYDLLDGGPVTVDGQELFEFRKADILEVGPTIFGANTATRTLALKARESGRPRLAKAVELAGELEELELEFGDDVSDETVDAALAAFAKLIANAPVEDLTGTDDDGDEDDPSSRAEDDDIDPKDLATIVANAVVEVLERRKSTKRPAAGATVTTAETEGKTRGKTDEDRSGGKSAEDRSAEDPPSMHPALALSELEAIALEADFT